MDKNIEDFFRKQKELFSENNVFKNKTAVDRKNNKEIVHILSPGRVNLIGEHTDYNSGLAIPLAIDKFKFFSGRKNGTDIVNIYDTSYKEYYSFSLDEISFDNKVKWTNYTKGVIKEYIHHGFRTSGIDIVISSNLLSGSGISSSAAILAGTAKLLEELFNYDIDGLKTMDYCHNAENNFVGIDNGILDHFSVLFGKKNNAIFLNFDNLLWEYVPFTLKESLILIIDSKEERYLPDTDYNKRRNECSKSLKIINDFLGKDKLKSLSGINPELLQDLKKILPSELYKRTKPVVSENERVKKVKKYLKNYDFDSIGSILLDSHKSLRDDYEVSTERLDFIVDSLSKLGGVYGARLMGAGFGGTVLSIVSKKRIDEIIHSLTKKYKEEFAIKPVFIPCSSSDGAKRFIR